MSIERYPQESVDEDFGATAAGAHSARMTDPTPISEVLPDVLAHIENHSPRVSEDL